MIPFGLVAYMGKEIIDLYGLQSMLKDGIERLFPSRIWLKAEISSVRVKGGGHCYMELCQSDEDGLKAKAQAVIWSSRYRLIAPYFESVAGTPLQDGMQVLVQVQVSFSQLYGLSLVVTDIDPGFSIGEKERQRRMTIARLHAEGLMDMQQSLELPTLPYRIAVISAPDAAGYRDFMKHLHENSYGFVFHTDLFPALMQGADSPSSIISAMDQVAASEEPYDILAILRGGGATLDLACYDDYDLAAHVAQFPVPVFTAIGHDQDCHVCDMVSYAMLKTPTALADELVGIYADEDNRLLSYGSRFRLAFSGLLYREESRLQAAGTRLSRLLSGRLSSLETGLSVLETRIHAADPSAILAKGYVLAVDSAGTIMKSAAGSRPGDRIDVLMNDGRLSCTVDAVSCGDDADRKVTSGN